MNLLKKAFVFLLAAVLCLSLTACGGSDSGGGDFIDSGKQADKYFHVSHNKNRRRKVK